MLGVWQANKLFLISQVYRGRRTEFKELYSMNFTEDIHAQLDVIKMLMFWTSSWCFNRMSLLRVLGGDECSLHVEEMQNIYGHRV